MGEIQPWRSLITLECVDGISSALGAFSWESQGTKGRTKEPSECLSLQAREDILRSVHCLSSLNSFIRREHFFFIKHFGPYPGCQQTNLQHWISTVLCKYNELPNGRKGSLLLCPSSLACSSGCSSFCLYRFQDLQKQKGTSHGTNTAKLGNTEPNC